MKKNKAQPKRQPGKSSEQIAQAIFTKIDKLVKKLQISGDGGNKEAKDKLAFFRWHTMRDYMKDIDRLSRAGQHASPPPIRTIFEMADFAIHLLLWLSEHQRENIKQYARERWAWPGYFHLSKREQGKYQALLPQFNQTGTKIIKESPIELGKNLGMKINANITKGDYLFRLAANAVNTVAQTDKEGRYMWGTDWLWFRTHQRAIAKLKGDKFHEAADKFFLSLGLFSKANWPKWKPVFETFLTFQYAPPELKFERIPKPFQENLVSAYHTGTHMQWFENFKKSHPISAVEETQFLEDMKKSAIAFEAPKPLHTVEQPEIREVIAGRKTQQGQWNALKKELLNRIENLAPAS